MTPQVAAQRMAAMSQALAVAMSEREAVAVQTVAQECITGAVEQRLLDHSLPVVPGDPTSSQLVYVIGGRRVHISQVTSVEVVDA